MFWIDVLRLFLPRWRQEYALLKGTPCGYRLSSRKGSIPTLKVVWSRLALRMPGKGEASTAPASASYAPVYASAEVCSGVDCRLVQLLCWENLKLHVLLTADYAFSSHGSAAI